MRPRAGVEQGRRRPEATALVLLAWHGLTAEELTREVSGETGEPVTLHAELSRLRRDLDGIMRAKPSACAMPVTSDVHDAERLLSAGRLRAALALAGERLLTASDAARAVEARGRLQNRLRAALLETCDGDLLLARCRGVPGPGRRGGSARCSRCPDQTDADQ